MKVKNCIAVQLESGLAKSKVVTAQRYRQCGSASEKRDHYKVPFEDISFGIRLVGGDCMGSQTSRFNLLNELLSELAY